MKRMLLLLGVSFSLVGISSHIKQAVKDHMVNGERELAIIVPTYNNARYISDFQCATCIKNLVSLLKQEYENFHIYIVNDVSKDKTEELLVDFLDGHPRTDHVTLISNEKRVGAMANIYNVVHHLPDHVIVLNFDGDDWALNNQVFARINQVYDNENVWLTYGQFIEYPSKKIGFCTGYKKEVIQNTSYRQNGLPLSHLRTFYAWLFKEIKTEDLMYEGEFAWVTWDKLMMAPMVEMSGGRFRCLDKLEPLYVYNAINPISDMRIRGQQQAEVRDYVFAMPPYEPLAPIITDFATDA